MQTLLHIFYILLCAVQILFGIGLIAIITAQESKSEGLTGQIGTVAQTSFKGKAGREDNLNLLTRNMAIVFFVASILVAFGTNRW